MANWTNTSRAYLGGTITSYMTLDATNAGAGSIPSSWNTYNDGTYSDAYYTPTAIFNGQVDTGIGRPRMFITQTGGSGDIKYKYRTSPTGSAWGSWNTLTSTYGRDYIDANDRWIDLEIVFYSPLWSDGDYFGIQTIGAQFIRFQKYSTIYAEEMNSNFNYLGGNRLPYGGLYLLPTTGVYDLGSDIYEWRKIYTYSVSSDSIETDDGYKLFKHMASVTLTIAASSIEISGIDLENYNYISMIIDYVAGTTTSTSVQLFMIVNGDSATSYGYQTTTWNNTTTSMITSRGTSGYFGLTKANTLSSYIYADMFVKHGIPRSLIYLSKSGEEGTHGNGYLSGQVWNDTTSTITSLKFYTTVVNGIGTGTTIKVFGKY